MHPSPDYSSSWVLSGYESDTPGLDSGDQILPLVRVRTPGRHTCGCQRCRERPNRCHYFNRSSRVRGTQQQHTWVFRPSSVGVVRKREEPNATQLSSLPRVLSCVSVLCRRGSKCAMACITMRVGRGNGGPRPLKGGHGPANTRTPPPPQCGCALPCEAASPMTLCCNCPPHTGFVSYGPLSRM